MIEKSTIKREIKKRYGEFAEQGSSCCPDYICCDIGYNINDIKDLSSEVSGFSLGCGNPVGLADIKEGEVVLDIGSGGGVDVFLASKRVGPKGKVIGLDMTEQMVERARKNALDGSYTNVEFKLADAEDIPLEDNSVDLVISNCVINLIHDKAKVYNEIYRVLRRGGRFIISDVVSEQDLDDSIKASLEKIVSCVGGALTEKKYIGVIKRAGFEDIGILNKSAFVISGVRMLSVTIRGGKDSSE